jgi:hypothetical protein
LPARRFWRGKPAHCLEAWVLGKFALASRHSTINTVDADGIALAAIQRLNQKLEEQLKEKELRIAALEQTITDLKRLVSRLNVNLQ